jgi:hypothetical protein
MRSFLYAVLAVITLGSIGCQTAPNARTEGAMLYSSGGVPMDAPNRATVENRYEFSVVIEWTDTFGNNQKLLAGRGAEMSLLFIGFDEVGAIRAFKADESGKPTATRLLVVPKRDGVGGIWKSREYVVR